MVIGILFKLILAISTSRKSLLTKGMEVNWNYNLIMTVIGIVRMAREKDTVIRKLTFCIGRQICPRDQYDIDLN